MSKPVQLENGVWVVEGDRLYSQWCSGPNGLLHDEGWLPIFGGLIKPGDVVLDIGANIGQSAYMFLQLGAKVHSFEPGTAAYQCLVKNCPDAIHYNKALGHRARLGGLIFDKGNPGASFVSDNDSDGDAINIATLDHLLFQKVDFIKIDAEGSEVAILKGGRETILRDMPKMFIEVNVDALRRQETSPAELFQLLHELGYKWTIAQHQCVESDPQFDAICTPIFKDKRYAEKDEF